MKSRAVTWAGAIGAVGCVVMVLKYLPFVSVLFTHEVPCSDGTAARYYIDYSSVGLAWTVSLGAAFLCLGRCEDSRVKCASRVGVVACMLLALPAIASMAFGQLTMIRFYEDLSRTANFMALLPVVVLDYAGATFLVVAIWELAELMPSRIRGVGYAGAVALAVASVLMSAASSLTGLVPCLAGLIATLCVWVDVLAFSILCVMFVLLSRRGLEASDDMVRMPFTRKLLLFVVVFFPIAVLKYMAF